MTTAEMNSPSSRNNMDPSFFSSEIKSESILKSPKFEKKYYENSRFFYTVGLFKFLIEEDIKVENLFGHAVNSVPHAPEWCSGMVNVRGNIIPIVDMHVFLKTGSHQPISKSKLLLLEHKNHLPIIFQIDKLPEVVSLDECTQGEMPKKSPGWLVQYYKNKEKNIYEVNHSDLLTQLKNIKI